VWIQGPYPAGKYTDIKIYNKVLRNFLVSGERVEADEGYRGHPDKIKIKCPGNDANPEENRRMQGRVRACHETLNERLKNCPLTGLPPPHHDARRRVPGVCGGDAAHHHPGRGAAV
jgi:hypothetical protein